MASTTNRNLISLIIGVALIAIILILMFIFPNANDKQFLILRILISLACAGVTATIPGFFQFKWKGLISAGGALGVFAFVYVLNPATITTDTFSITVFPTTDNKENIISDLDQAKIILDLEGDRRIEVMDKRGFVRFTGIPPKFVNQFVHITIDGEIFTARKDSTYKIYSNASIYMPIQNKNLDILNGLVIDDQMHLVSGAVAEIDDIVKTTDSSGRFKIEIPEANQARIKTLTVSKYGYKTWIGSVTPETKQTVEIKLSK